MFIKLHRIAYFDPFMIITIAGMLIIHRISSRVQRKYMARDSNQSSSRGREKMRLSLSVTTEHERMIRFHCKARPQRRESIHAESINLKENFVAPSYEKSEEIIQFIDSSLSGNFIFDSLARKDRRGLIAAMSRHSISAGKIIIEQGDIGDYFYVLEKGEVNFIVDEKLVGTCAHGKCFGELALLYNCLRSATCQAKIDCVLWRVDQRTFRHMLANNRANENKAVIDILKKVPFLSELDEVTLSKVTSALTPMNFPEGKKIVKKGSVGRAFYIVREGTIKVHDIGHGDSQYADQVLGPGDFFGEQALLTGERRAANITAVTDCSTLCLSREVFEMTLGNLENLMKTAIRKRFLMGVPIFANSKFELHEMTKLAELFVDEMYPEGSVLQQKGDAIVNSALYIIESGSVTIVNENGIITTLGKGDHFGEQTIKADEDEASQERIVVMEDSTFAVLAKSSIESVIGSVSRFCQPQSFQSKIDRSINLENFQKHCILGAGTFGHVWLVNHKDTDKAYALKQIDKVQTLNRCHSHKVILEKNLMASMDHPFIIKLVSTFQDDSNLYMLMNLLQGGELFSLIHTETEDGISDQSARFYAACILDSLSYMHHLSVCYRDLKPENVMIDRDGYCILIDLGFAKVVVDKTYTLCGTPEYLAPEVILSHGHDKSVDFWALGILIYEMLVGHSPFWMEDQDQMELFSLILEKEPSYPSDLVNEAARDLIQSLLEKRPINRIGCLAKGCKNIREHEWFKEIEFEKLLKKKIEAPWVPEITDPFDLSHFYSYDDLEENVAKKSELNMVQQMLFENF